MKPLYACRACGFLSTRKSEFTRRAGIVFDLDCLERADAGEMPVAGWVAEAIERLNPAEEAQRFPQPIFAALAQSEARLDSSGGDQ